jgi:hypothetical protein
MPASLRPLCAAAAATTLIVLLAVDRVAVQSRLEGGELAHMRLALVPIQPTTDEQKKWRDEPHWSFDGFDEARFGFRSFGVLLERTPMDCGPNDKRASIRVVVRADGVRGPRYWAAEESLPPDKDPCEIDDLSAWSLTSFDSEHSMAGLATPDPSVPIVDVQSPEQHHRVLDLRQLPPVIAARVVPEVQIDRFCEFAEPRPATSCEWNATRADFFCTETLGGGRRLVWMTTGERVATPPGVSPRSLENFVNTLVASKPVAGAWTESADVGAVRMITELPSATAGRRVFLFGASDEFGAPFVLAVREKGRTRVVPMKVEIVEPVLSPSWVLLGRPPVPVTEFRPHGEPPLFTSKAIGRDALGTRLFRIVANNRDGRRQVYHLAVQETRSAVVGHAVRYATSTLLPALSLDVITSREGTGDPCVHDVAGFARPVQISFAPLRIDYDVEPTFRFGGDGEPERNEETCVVSARALWQSGKGFAIESKTDECSDNVFRAAHVRADGSIEVRRRPAPR